MTEASCFTLQMKKLRTREIKGRCPLSQPLRDGSLALQPVLEWLEVNQACDMAEPTDTIY